MRVALSRSAAMRWVLFMLFGAWAAPTLHAQNFNQDPGNPDMDCASGDWGPWRLSWGARVNPYENSGRLAVLSTHLIMGVTGTNFDGQAGPGNLPRVPSGLERVMRLGAPAGGGYGEPKSYAMRYTVTIHADYPILCLQLASVMDNTHLADHNTNFRYRLLNAAGQPLEQPCGGFRMYPRGGTPTPPLSNNFITDPEFGHTSVPARPYVVYQPWQTIAIDMSDRVGEQIQIVFEHADCNTGYHGSYTYLSTGMRQVDTEVYYCPYADTVAVEALPRFKWYRWSNGDTTQVANVVAPRDGDVYTCTVGSFNGCEAEFTFTLREDRSRAAFDELALGCNAMAFVGVEDSLFPPATHWAWEFGDSGQAPNDTASGDSVSFDFSGAGTYTVAGIRTSVHGCLDTLRRSIDVGNASAAAFSYEQACDGRPVRFTDVSSGQVIDHLWHFGDGASATDASPEHTYAGPGTYRVVLVTENVAGCVDSTAQDVTVGAMPRAAFNMPTSWCATVPLVFANGSQDASAYAWTFGDGATSTERDPVYVYAEAGSVEVVLVAVHASGCADTIRHALDVLPTPTAGFDATPERTTTAGPAVVFTNRSTGGTLYEWDLADGGSSTQRDLSHGYANTGVYNVRLVVSDPAGCSDTAWATIVVLDAIVVPNVFTPNDDGVNDRFRIAINPDVARVELLVYDRWGLEMHRSSDPQQGWDGRSANGDAAPAGTYYHLITITNVFGEVQELRGAFTLLR